jgi:adenosylcobinamide kinase/adenosylcobinamide-phosphate guanylyltransferase
VDGEVTGQLTRVQQQRDGWHRIETTDLPRALIKSRDPVVLDGLDSWIPALLADVDAVSDPDAGSDMVHDLVDQLQVALMAVPVDVVVLSHDPTWGPAASAPEQELAQDLLAAVNRRVGATCGGVDLIVAGRVLDLRNSLPAQGAALR